MAAKRNWTEDEIIEAIGLYIRTPFGKIHSRNPDIINLAKLLDRTPSSIALKMSNLASIDESLDRKGMSNSSALDKATWKKYFGALKSFTENLPNNDNIETPLGFSEMQQAEFDIPTYEGLNIPRITNVRQGQSVFRQMVLATYDQKCAITGISQESLLIAGHISPWSSDSANRMNPRNGICLNRLHDRAFESHLITIENNGRVIYSKKLDLNTKEKMKRMSDDGYFVFPRKFKPDLALLESHRSKFIE